MVVGSITATTLSFASILLGVGTKESSSDNVAQEELYEFDNPLSLDFQIRTIVNNGKKCLNGKKY